MRTITAEILRGCWYVAGISAALKRKGMIVTRLAGEPVVIARGEDGTAFALRDTCPHRGIPLHHGEVLGDTLRCPYHGWRFDASGACVEIPSLYDGQKVNLSRIKCPGFRVTERYGLIWIYLPSDDAGANGMTEPPALGDLPHDSTPRFNVTMDFESSIDHSVLALMDLTHAPFVHNLWWFKKDPTKLRPKEKVFEPAPFGFRMRRHAVPPQNAMYRRLLGNNATTEVHYMLPAYRIESIISDRHWAIALTAHTPLDAENTLVHQCFWSSVSWVAPFTPLLRHLARTFLGQDRHYVRLQREGLMSAPKLMLLNDGDTQARWWMRLKDEWVSANANARPFQNPVPERTLRWRS